jgi:hypothetical protein
MQTTDTSLIGDVLHPPLGGGQPTGLDAVLAMTRELFPGQVVVRRKSDPEIADESYYSLGVQVKGSVEEIVAKDSLWHRRLLEIAPEPVGLYRLSMDVR